jgi:hypothetical protein
MPELETVDAAAPAEPEVKCEFVDFTVAPTKFGTYEGPISQLRDWIEDAEEQAAESEVGPYAAKIDTSGAEYGTFVTRKCEVTKKFYEKLIKMWAESPAEVAYAEFAEEADKKLCTEWAKVDERGKHFRNEFWTAPEGTEKYKNAFVLTREHNIATLHSLPFPKPVVLYIADACNSCDHSIANVVDICHFVQEKYKQLNGGKSPPTASSSQ